jgi:uncharacterized membrane protein
MRRKSIVQTETSTFRKAAKKKGVILAAVLSLALVFVLSACSANQDTGSTGNANGSTAENADVGSQGINSGDDLVIPVSEISETPAFYPVTVDGTRMEVFAVKVGDTIRTAFNTCQVCNGSPKAYFEVRGTSVQCQNCGNKFAMSKIGIESGGCNPVPILDNEKTATIDTITIPYKTLQANAYRFPANWKQ